MLLLNSCSLLDPEENIPSYIALSSPVLKTTNQQEGSNSHKISDYWVYVGDEYLGVYEFPVEIPVLQNGDKKIQVFAGIKENGVSAQRIQYPFYTPFENDTTATLIAGESSSISPLFQYHSTTKFPWIEDFESLNISLTEDAVSLAKVESYNGDQVFEGNGCARIALNDTNFRAHIIQAQKLVLPGFGTDIYLELNYKNDLEFFIGLRAIYNDGSAKNIDLVGVNPSDTWNKIYVDIKPFVSQELNANSFQIYFYTNYRNSKAEEEIFLDNIKLLHF